MEIPKFKQKKMFTRSPSFFKVEDPTVHRIMDHLEILGGSKIRKVVNSNEISGDLVSNRRFSLHSCDYRIISIHSVNL